jgi:hypothetical protein
LEIEDEETRMNEKTLVALYDDAAAAYRAVDELEGSGIARERTRVVSGAADAVPPGEGFNAQTGAGAVEESRGFGVPGTDLHVLTDLGVPEQDALVYAEGVRRGGSLLMVELDAGQAERALDVLARHGRVDAAERGRMYRDEDRAGLGAAAAAMRGADAAPGPSDPEHPRIDPVAEQRARSQGPD